MKVKHFLKDKNTSFIVKDLCLDIIGDARDYSTLFINTTNLIPLHHDYHMPGCCVSLNYKIVSLLHTESWK